MRFHILLFLSLVLAFAACEKDSTTEIVTFTQTTLSGETVTANFYGHLTNDQGEAVSDAEVRIGNKQTTTDQEGLWSIDNATVVKDQAYIQFAATSHHKGSRTLLVEAANTYKVDVELLAFTGNHTVESSTGGTVSIAGTNASVSFPSAAFSRLDDTPYSGTVRVEAAYLDPNAASIGDRMPGDLRATTAEGDSRMLISYGMMSVELFDDAGNELKLASGQRATLSLPVAGEAAITAPASIPLWFFDEATAQWIEEGTATLQNGSYVGEVSHFTFWNCDIPTEYIRLCGTVVFEGVDSVTAANLRLIIESTNWGNGYGHTNGNGEFCGIVPANETLTLLVSPGGPCQQVVYSVTIGPYSSDTDLGTIIVPQAQNLLANVSGTASCNGTPLTSGAVRIFQNGRQIEATAVEPDGSWSTSFLTCDSSELTIQVVNYDNLSESEELVFAFSNTLNTGDIESCSQVLTNYFELIIDGVTQVGDSAVINQDGSFSMIFGNADNGNGYFGFEFITDVSLIPLTVGTYTIVWSPNQEGLYIRSNNLTFGGLGVQTDFDLTINSLPTQASPYTVGQIGPIEETVTDSMGTSITHNILINFSAFTN